MGQIVIFRNGSPHLNLIEKGKRTINDGTLTRTMLSDDTVDLKVSSNSVLDIRVNDYFTLFGENYRINQVPEVDKINDSNYNYIIKAQGLMYDLLRCKFFNADGSGFKTTLDFPLIGTLELFLTVIKNNMSRFSDKWDFAPLAEAGETKTLTFGSDTCLSALQKICQEFKTDFWVKSEGGKFVIHTGAFGSTVPVTFEYGKGKGLYGLSRKNVNEEGVINRMYVEGGSENLPNNYRNFSNNLKFSDEGYLEDSALISQMGLKEGDLKLEEIYPHRTGKVTALGDTKFKFIDNTMDFDLNEKEADGITTKYLKPDTSAKIHFNTGNLAGYQFEIKKGGYKHATKEFEIIPITTTGDQKMPDSTTAAFQFGVNDEYVLLDIYAPEIYITNAENELLTKATEQFNLKKQIQVSYDLTVDPAFLKDLATPINIGDYVRVKDGALNVDKVIRVNSIVRNFIQNREWKENVMKLVIADSYEISFSSQLILDVKEIVNVNNITGAGQINYSMIGLKTTRELQSLVFDTDGYFNGENIRPNSIETNMLSVGSQSQQLSCSVVFRVNADGLKNKIVSETGKVFSQTFNKTWDIPALTTTLPDDNYRYVYAKCSKTGSAGSIFYTQSQIKFDTDPNDYYFLLGILHTVVEGMRVLSITVGTTTINGGLVRTGIISSLDGQTSFNLNTGEIKGKITFTNDSPAFQQMNDAIVIGGRNFALGTKTPKSAPVSWIMYPLSPEMTSGDYMLTYDYTAAAANNIGISLGTAGGYDGAYEHIETVPDGTHKFSRKITFVRTDQTHLCIYVNAQTEITNLKLEKGTKATDWTPAPEDVEQEIQEVQNYAETVNNLVSDIANDNKLTPSEKQQLKQEYDIIVAEKPQISAQATPYLITAEKTAYNAAYNNLVAYVNPLIVNLNNTSDVDGVTLRNRFTSYYTAKVNLLKAITDAVDNNLDSVWTEMENLQNSVNQEIADVTQQVNDLEGYVDGSFADGIISQAEAVAIETYINQINTEKADIDNKYNQIYNDSYLSGTPKTILATDYNNYVSSHINLINSINTAISDGATTPAEKSDVDSKFSAYRYALGVLTTRFQEAIKAIETATVNAIQVGGRNLIKNSSKGWSTGGYYLGELDLTEDLIDGQEYVITAWGALAGSNQIYVGQSPSTVNIAFMINNAPYQYQYKFTFNKHPSYPNDVRNKIVIYNYGSTDYSGGLNKFKLEKGTKATDWTPAPEDIDVAIAGANANSANALAQAQNAMNTAAAAAAVTNFMQTTIDGNVVSTGTLQVGDVNGANAMISGVTDKPNGESIRFAAGKSYDEKYLSPFQVLDNGMVRFVNPANGQKTFELGYNQNIGKVVFDIFNENGIKVASIGSQGIMFTGYVPESYTKRKFRKLTTTSFTESAIKAELVASILLKRLISTYPPGPATDGTQYHYEIGLNTNTVAYEYYEGRNFESADNAQYVGFYTTENKFGTKLPDGIYLKQYIASAMRQMSTGANSVGYSTEAYLLQNGRIISSIEIWKSLTITGIPDKTTDWLPEDYE